MEGSKHQQTQRAQHNIHEWTICLYIYLSLSLCCVFCQPYPYVSHWFCLLLICSVCFIILFIWYVCNSFYLSLVLSLFHFIIIILEVVAEAVLCWYECLCKSLKHQAISPHSLVNFVLTANRLSEASVSNWRPDQLVARASPALKSELKTRANQCLCESVR